MSRFNAAIILSDNSIVVLTFPIRRRPTRGAGSGIKRLSDGVRIWLKEDTISCQPLRKPIRIRQVSVWLKQCGLPKSNKKKRGTNWKGASKIPFE